MKAKALLYAAVVAVVSLSCTREVEDAELLNTGIDLEFTAEWADENGTDSRTILQKDGTSIWWSANEEINVFIGEDVSAKFVSTNTQPQRLVSFVGNVLIGAVEQEDSFPGYWAVYPYKAENSCDGQSLTLSLPHIQEGKANGFADKFFPSVARSNNFLLSFWNVCGGARFSVTREGIKRIVFKSIDDSPMAGKVKVGFSEDNKPQILEFTEPVDSVVVNAPEGGFVPGTNYFAAMLPQTHAEGLINRLYTQDKKATRTFVNSITVKRSTFGLLDNLDDSLEYVDYHPFPLPEEVTLSATELNFTSDAGSQTLTLKATLDWGIQGYDEAARAWLAIDPDSGKASAEERTITFTVLANPENDRSATLTFYGNVLHKQTITITQSGTLQPDSPGQWLELPALDRSDCCFFTHSMTQGSYRGRNYSFYLAPNDRIALWVAYPLNKTLIGSGSRSEEWALDPKVPEQYQSVVYSGYRGGGYDRGHQLPSADRFGYEINETTFYGTNITPQLSGFNQNIWAHLEGMVRSWSNSFDTLYVVTGADIRGATKVAYDNYYKEITVPTGYYKVLLGYKRGGTVGITSTTGGYTGIAFYFEHRNDYPNTKDAIFQQSMTIDAIEEKLGIDFFVNLPSVAGAAFAAKVESSIDAWWEE